MSHQLKVRIFEGDELKFETELSTKIVVGRQRANDPNVYSLVPTAESTPLPRLLIAERAESNYSRHHLEVEPLVSGKVRIKNCSQIPIHHDSNAVGSITSGAIVDLDPPFRLTLDRRQVQVAYGDEPDEQGMSQLSESTFGPAGVEVLAERWKSLAMLDETQLDSNLIGWLQMTMGVLQSTVGSADFLAQAAKALVQIVGLDSGRVLLFRGSEMVVAAVHEARPDSPTEWRPSQHVLQRVMQDKRTYWLTPQGGGVQPATKSLQQLSTVVAAPLLDAQNRVIGALYGERRHTNTDRPVSSGRLEAMLVDLVACGVATGLARQEKEKAAVQARVQFEQFFTPELAHQLRQKPDMLHGREAEVTLLFCDVRNFSHISEQLGPAGTVSWIYDVLNDLSECVLNEQGVLVDYIGDELMAMWGAPSEQPDQVSRAVRAAVAMLERVTKLSERWRTTIGAPMSVGIGINTGLARVGNTGSRFKFKYGALGNSVNLASRIQGLTKYLRCSLLVTEASRLHLGGEHIARRVCRARVVNIEKPVNVYHVEPRGDEERLRFFHASEEALTALESKEFAMAARKAGALLATHQGDGPMLLVLSRAANQLVEGGVDFDPTWDSPGK